MGKVIWFTGHSGAGKTTIAKEYMKFRNPKRLSFDNLRRMVNVVLLDGDEMRESVSLGAGFSKEDRKEHNLRIARLAKVLSEQVDVLVAVIAPIREVREEITKICNPLWIWVKRTMEEREGHFYEEPEAKDGYIILDHDKFDVRKSSEYLRTMVRELA